MPSVTVTKVSRSASGRVYVSFGKTVLEFPSLADMKSWADTALSVDSLRAVAIALMITRQPALGNPSVFEGRSVNVDFSSTNWGTLS